MTLLYGAAGGTFAGKIFFKTAGKGPPRLRREEDEALPGNGLSGEPEENHPSQQHFQLSGSPRIPVLDRVPVPEGLTSGSAC